jgi:hypothetical protein
LVRVKAEDIVLMLSRPTTNFKAILSATVIKVAKYPKDLFKHLCIWTV